MPTDWKELEDGDQHRWQRISVMMGIIWISVGAIGAIVLLAIGQTSRIPGSLIWILIGLVILAPGIAARKRPRRDDA